MATTNHGRNISPPADLSKRWENLSTDLLLMIFSRIGVEDLIAGVPYVCSTWWRAVRDPFCWRRLDFENWDAISHRLGCRREDEVDFADLLEFAITRSQGFIDSFHFPEFADEFDLDNVANRCPKLHYFSMRNPDIFVVEFCKAIGKLKYLKGMAVDESMICHQVLQHVNHCCDNFIELKVFSDVMDKEMASSICECLPHLQKLQITNCLMSKDVILALLDGLKKITYLDISGYPLRGITRDVVEKASHIKDFRWDSTHDLGDFEYLTDWDNDFFSQKLMEWLANDA